MVSKKPTNAFTNDRNLMNHLLNRTLVKWNAVTASPRLSVRFRVCYAAGGRMSGFSWLSESEWTSQCSEVEINVWIITRNADTRSIPKRHSYECGAREVRFIFHFEAANRRMHNRSLRPGYETQNMTGKMWQCG